MENSDKNFSDQKHILIAEDSNSQAENLIEILTQNGYKVTAVQDGMDGLVKLTRFRPDLIISDIWMPRMNGYEFCRALKNNKNFHAIPVILLTALTDTEDIIKGLRAGADYYITKPFDKDLLLSDAASILSNTGPRVRNDDTATVEVRTKDKSYQVSLNPQNILNFLISTSENLFSQNRDLLQTKRELKDLNDNLEEIVREKTHFLSKEISERKKAEDAVKKSLESVRKSLDGTVNALAKTIEMRDPYTAGHQRRVAQLACAIAKAMGFTEERLEGMQVIGFLHDLGKIVVPAEILSKPGKLNEVEFSMIKAHAEVGYNILKDIEFPWPVNIAVLQHHERLNGSGYPGGLLGQEIIVEARILAVADVVESMASHRPYRPALGVEKALVEILKNRGILFDEKVVDTCISLFEEKGFALFPAA